MKISGLIVALAAALATSGATAQSMCGWTDKDRVLGALQGDWMLSGGVSVVTLDLDIVQPIENNARLVDDIAEVWSLEPVTLNLGAEYDVDGVDDMLETAEVEWIADAVSATPCGPEGLPQLRAEMIEGELGTGHLTLIPYFTDRVVVVVQSQARGDWGLAYVTMAGLLTRK